MLLQGPGNGAVLPVFPVEADVAGRSDGAPWRRRRRLALARHRPHSRTPPQASMKMGLFNDILVSKEIRIKWISCLFLVLKITAV